MYIAQFGPIPPNRVVNLRNADKLDNRLGNLELIDRSANAIHWARPNRSMAADRIRSGLCGRALEIMKTIPDDSMDMILADLPYGTTACKLDSVIPFAPLWEQYRRVIKQRGAIVLTASQPFTTSLISTNARDFRYCWIWNKAQSGNPMLAKHQPLKITGDVCVFSIKPRRYYPQMRTGRLRKKGDSKKPNLIVGSTRVGYETVRDRYYPTT